MVDGHIGPVMPHLLLSRPMHFLKVMEVLLDGGAIGDCFQDLRHRRLGIGTEERDPAVVVVSQYHPDQASRRLVSGQEGFVSRGNLLAIKPEVFGLPALSMSRTLGEADRFLAVLGFGATLLGLAGTRSLGYG